VANGWQKTHRTGEKSATRHDLDRRIERISSDRLRLITTAQLTGLGLSHNALHARVRAGRLHRLHAGVYAVHPPPFTRNQRWLGATMACGPGALLSDGPAALLQRITDSPAPLPAHITAESGRGRSRQGIVVHRRGPVDPRDVRRVEGVPCVSVDLVLIQLAPTHSGHELERMIVAAESLGFLKRGRLAELVEQHHGCPGIHRLRSLLALEPALTRSDLEGLYLPICAQAGLDRPLVNLPVPVPGRTKPLSVDFAWPSLRMIVEADSQRFHGDWERAEIDRDRDQLLALAGWICHRFVRRMIVNDPAGSAQRLRLLAEVRTAELSAATS